MNEMRNFGEEERRGRRLGDWFQPKRGGVKKEIAEMEKSGIQGTPDNCKMMAIWKKKM